MSTPSGARPMPVRTARALQRLVRAMVFAVCLASAGRPASAQLAITEVMSEAADSVIPRRPDFWELTNFGAETIDLTPYRWVDSAGFDAADPRFFTGKSIGPGESIILVRGNVVSTLTAADFVNWWGPGNFDRTLQVLFYKGPGFSQDYDAVQLWKVTAQATNLVDRVDFYSSTPGSTFTYDPQTGLLRELSREGVGGAFRSAGGTDTGSPGRTTGPVPLKVTRSPVSVEVDAGSSAEFSVAAQGLPRPRFQWRRNGVAIPGGTGPVLTLPNVTPSDAGIFTVVLDNGVESLVSAGASLAVNVVPSCARIVAPPSDLELTPDQEALFTVVTRGYPVPACQWFYDGRLLPGATNTVLRLPGAGAPLRAVVSVQVTNAFCTVVAEAILTVIPRPDLRVTEIMAFASPDTPGHRHGDWWELTNFEPRPVPLRGYRFDDSPGVLDGAVVVTNDVVLQPGESAVFISDMTVEEFVDWWGAANLPPGLKIIPYAGNSFDALGDALFLWNPTATLRADVIASLSFVADTRGASLWFDPVLAEFGEVSIEGERGAFRAADGEDVGSPGWIDAHESPGVPPRVVNVSQDTGRIVIVWSTQPGASYALESAEDPGATEWSTTATVVADSDTFSLVELYGQSSRRFFRLRHSPDLPP